MTKTILTPTQRVVKLNNEWNKRRRSPRLEARKDLAEREVYEVDSVHTVPGTQVLVAPRSTCDVTTIWCHVGTKLSSSWFEAIDRGVLIVHFYE